MGEGLLQDAEAAVIVSLAGRAAEEFILGTVSAGAGGSPYSDLAQATQSLLHQHGRTGLVGKLQYQDQVGSQEIESHLQRLYAGAMMLVLERRPQIERVANALLEVGFLREMQIKAIAFSAGVNPSEQDSGEAVKPS